MSQEISLHIILSKPVPGVEFGLQEGSGNTYKTIQKQRSAGNDLDFKFTAIIKGDRLKDELPKLSGPFVQGPAGAKFVYIDIGTAAGQMDSVWSRRLKIPLSGISWNIADQLLKDSSLLLETTVPGTGRDGGPNCATVKPFNGWKVKAGKS